MQNKTVDFFLIGAPKCGTTAMASYLSIHKNICISNPKETNFFCDDFHNTHTKLNAEIHSVDEYQRKYFNKNIVYEKAILGDASVWNLYSENAIQNILNYNSEAKFLVMIRNPSDMINSLYSMYLGLGVEFASNLKEAFDLEDTRIAGIKIKQNILTDPQLLIYSQIGKLGKQLERLYCLVSTKKIKVICYDDFKINPELCFVDTLKFLELDWDDKQEFQFKKVNSQKIIHSKIVQKLYINQHLRKATRSIKGKLGIKTFGLGIAKIPLSKENRLMMNSIFKKDITKISEILNRDFSYWLT